MREGFTTEERAQEAPKIGPAGAKARSELLQKEVLPGQPQVGPEPDPELKTARSSATSDGTETPPDQEAKTGFELPGDG